MGILKSNNYICALDIGSSKISAVFAEINRKSISNIYFETGEARGIKKSTVVDSVDLINSLNRVLKNLKLKSGVNVKCVYANISGQNIVTKHSRAIRPLAERGNKIITESDLQKVKEQARILGSSLEEEIIHQIPYNFTIDSADNILNPVGLYSHRLELDLYLISGKVSPIQNLVHLINQAGYEVKDLFFNGIAVSEALFDKELKEGVSIFCDIGSDITEILLFKNGVLRDIKILSLGGDDLTSQLSESLKIPFDLAEDVKKSYAVIGDYSHINEDKEILIKKDNVYIPIKQKLVCEMANSKVNSICQQLKGVIDGMESANRADRLIAVGGTVLLDGFLETLENNLGIPVRLGRITASHFIPFLNNEHSLTGQKYLNYVSALGIICLAISKEQTQTLTAHKFTSNLFLKAINRAKEIYQEYF